jgi:hypothetical protein
MGRAQNACSIERGPEGLGMNATLKELGGALWQGVRSALLLRPRAEALDIGLSAAVALCVLELLGSAAFDLTSLGGAGAFDAGGLTREIATSGVLLALLVWLPFRGVGAHPRRLFAGVLALSIIVSAVFVPVRLAARKLSAAATAVNSAQLDWIVFAATAGALIWTVAAALRLGFGLAERQRVLSGLALAGTVIVASLVLPQAPMFPGENDEERSEFSVVQFAANALKPARGERKMPQPQSRIDVEAAMYRQPGLLAASLSALKPPREDQAEIYYVGMAASARAGVRLRWSTTATASRRCRSPASPTSTSR